MARPWTASKTMISAKRGKAFLTITKTIGHNLHLGTLVNTKARTSRLWTNQNHPWFERFPEPLYQVQYAAPAILNWQRNGRTLFRKPVGLDHDWGLDHARGLLFGTCIPMPVFRCCSLASIIITRILSLRVSERTCCAKKRGVLILGSGNMA